MKDRILFLLMMLATSFVACGQNTDIYDTQYFSCRDYHTKNGTTIYLYEKGNVERPQSIDQYASVSDNAVGDFFDHLCGCAVVLLQ